MSKRTWHQSNETIAEILRTRLACKLALGAKVSPAQRTVYEKVAHQAISDISAELFG